MTNYYLLTFIFFLLLIVGIVSSLINLKLTKIENSLRENYRFTYLYLARSLNLFLFKEKKKINKLEYFI